MYIEISSESASSMIHAGLIVYILADRLWILESGKTELHMYEQSP